MTRIPKSPDRSDASPDRAGTHDAGEDGGIDASALLKNRRELVIRHSGERYILRLTSNNRLILTK